MDNTLIVIALSLVCLFAYLKRSSTNRPPLPPGPPADPLIGHLRVMPSDNHGLVFHEWSKTYGMILFPSPSLLALSNSSGDVIHLKILGRNIIVLNSVQAATDLLEKRSGLYSDRPNLTVYVA